MREDWGLAPLVTSKLTTVVKVCAGKPMADAILNARTIPTTFNKRSFSTAQPPTEGSFNKDRIYGNVARVAVIQRTGACDALFAAPAHEGDGGIGKPAYAPPEAFSH